MPDTLPYQPDLSGGDRAVVDHTVADSVSKSTAPGGDASPPIARRLAILVIVATLPVLAFSAFMIVRYAQVEHIQYQHQLHDTTRATMRSVDAMVSSEIAILVTLSHTSEVRTKNWRAFYDLAKSTVADQPNARIGLYDPAGHVLLSTFVPFGADMTMSGSPDAIREVVTTMQPYITDLYVGTASKEFVIAVFVPVIENGVVVNILSIAVPPGFISRILQSQFRTIGGVGAVFDRQARLIGRTRSESEFVGRKAVPGYAEALQKSDEGSLDVRNLEGLLVRSVYVKSTLSGWSTTLAVENATLDAPLWRSLWIFGGGGLLFAVALLWAFYYARSFAGPVATLTAVAQSLARGDRLPQKRVGLREMQIIGDRMVLASEALKRHADERENLLTTLEVRTSQLTESNEQLKVANRELEGFSYSTSHVLRAPLRAIDGYSHILLEDHSAGLGSEAKRMIGALQSSAHELNEQIDGILEFLRIGRDRMSRGTIAMAEAVQAALQELEPKTQGRNLKIAVSPLPRAFGDAATIQRVWMCLLDNALKFTAPKAEAKIEVGALSDGAETVYYVRDNGVGFDMKYADKLFGVFQHLHSAEDFPGTGIGLAIVNRIVTRHGGRVWAEGKVGEGATFWFHLAGRGGQP